MAEIYDALQIPPRALDQGGMEILRAAIIEGGLHVTLRTAFAEPQAWGMVLADVTRQVARAYGHQNLFTDEEVIAKIREAFEADLSAPPTKTSDLAPL
jgi:hypothetical protein